MDSASISELEAISPQDFRYRWSIEELMKVHYRNQNWGSFFAYAQFYRRNFSLNDRGRIQALEALALLRHCQTAHLQSLIHELETQSWFSTDLRRQIEALSQTRFKGKSVQREIPRILRHWKGESLKPISKTEVSKLDPKKLYIQVENLCSEGS